MGFLETKSFAVSYLTVVLALVLFTLSYVPRKPSRFMEISSAHLAVFFIGLSFFACIFVFGRNVLVVFCFIFLIGCILLIVLRVSKLKGLILASFVLGTLTSAGLIQSVIFWDFEFNFLIIYIGAVLIAACTLISLSSYNIYKSKYLGFVKASLQRPASAFEIISTVLAIVLAIAYVHSNLSLAFITEAGAHHWSGYLGVAQLQAAGFEVLRDFPSQYGTGYIWVLSFLGCKTDCWSSMAVFFLLADITWALSLFGLILLAVKTPNIFVVSGCALLIFLAFTVLTAYPANPVSPLLAPSVRERFASVLLASLLAAFIVRSDLSHSVKSVHVILLVIALFIWSLYALLFFLPVLAVTSIYIFAGMRNSLQRIGAAALLSFTSLFCCCILYFAYIKFRFGDVNFAPWYFLLNSSVFSSLGISETYHYYFLIVVPFIALIVSFRQSLKLNFSGVVVGILSLSSFLYWIGRPHPNNYFNIIIFNILFYLIVVGSASRPPIRWFFLGSLFGLLSVVSSVNGYFSNLNAKVQTSPLALQGVIGFSENEASQVALLNDQKFTQLHNILRNVVKSDPFFVAARVGAVGSVDDVVLPVPPVLAGAMPERDLRRLISRNYTQTFEFFWLVVPENPKAEGINYLPPLWEELIKFYEPTSSFKNQQWRAIRLNLKSGNSGS